MPFTSMSLSEAIYTMCKYLLNVGIVVTTSSTSRMNHYRKQFILVRALESIRIIFRGLVLFF